MEEKEVKKGNEIEEKEVKKGNEIEEKKAEKEIKKEKVEKEVKKENEIEEEKKEKEEKEEEKLYYLKLCKNKRYLINDIKKIDGEYLIKIDPYKSGVIAYTKKYGYIFERTVHYFYFFKERINLNDEEKKELENEEPLTDREGYCYTYSDKDLKLAFGDHPPVSEKIEIIKIIIDKYKKILNEQKEKK